MSAYQEFTGKSVEEALRAARETFGIGLEDLDFEILTPGSRGVLGMGAEPARIIAAPRSALGGVAPKRDAAASQPLPPSPREDRPREDRPREGGRDRGRAGYDRGPRSDAPRSPETADRPAAGSGPDLAAARPSGAGAPDDRPPSAGPRRDERAPRRDDRGPRRDDRGPRPQPSNEVLSEGEAAQVEAARSLAREREELQAAEASPEALAAGKGILDQILRHLEFAARVDVETGETSRLNVVGEGEDRENLGALIGRKGERLSALQHLVNLMLSRQMGEWTRVLVDVEDYRGRRERQLREIALRAAEKVAVSGKMLQLEPMPALERRWIHIALRDHPDVATQSIGEEPNRRVVILRRPS
jgi:spoIIIJ-associated protein